MKNLPFSEICLLVGRLDDLIEDAGLGAEQVAQVLGLPRGRWSTVHSCPQGWHPDRWQETRLRRFIEVLELVRSAVGSRSSAGWWASTNEGLEDRVPIDVLRLEPSALRAVRDALRSELHLDAGSCRVS